MVSFFLPKILAYSYFLMYNSKRTKKQKIVLYRVGALHKKAMLFSFFVPNTHFLFFHTHMKKLASKGFTLIELLVVITIIGILATGATTVYTSAQQKARDSQRQADILAVKTALEQKYADDTKYPNPSTGTDLVTDGYIDKIPADAKTGEDDGNAAYAYMYAAGDKNGVPGQTFELSANFESSKNDTKESGDSGNDANAWEVGNDTGTLDSSNDGNGTVGSNNYNGAAQDAIVVAD